MRTRVELPQTQPQGGQGWFCTVLSERLRRSAGRRAARDWRAVYPNATAEERADAHVAHVARLAALYGGLSAASGHIGEAVTVLTGGAAAPLCVPAVMASLTGEVLASTKAQIDLVLDLGSIYGVAFETSDMGEIIAILDLALRAGDAGAGATPSCTDNEILVRLGRSLFESAVLGLVPLVGIPCSAAARYRSIARVGAHARGVLRRRVAQRNAPDARPSGVGDARHDIHTAPPCPDGTATDLAHA
jgi:hypothetical protein